MKFADLVPQKLKSWFSGPDQCDPSVRGPVWGIGELGGYHLLDPLDGTGFQRNLDKVGAYGACSALFGCVNVIAQAMATLEMRHTKLLESGGHEVVITSALSRVIRSPNRYQTASDFMMNLMFGLLYTGNAYALAMRNDRFEVDSLHIMPPLDVAPYIDSDTQEIFYSVGENPLVTRDVQYLIPARDVMHLRLYTPRHPLVGISPIKHASLAISINTSIGANQAAFFNNMSRPSGILSSDSQFTAEQMRALRAAFEEKSRGMGAGGVPILGWGLKWQPMTITSEDAQLIEAYRMSIEDIARVFRVPLALLGDYTKATYANTEQMISAWLATGLGFMLEHVENSFEKFFRLPNNERVEFDVDMLLRTDFEARINGLTKAISGGLYSPNEARAREGLKAVKDGEEPRVQAQVVPLSQVNATPAPTPPSSPAPSTEPAEPAEPAGPDGEDEEDKQLAAEFVARRAIEKAMAA